MRERCASRELSRVCALCAATDEHMLPKIGMAKGLDLTPGDFEWATGQLMAVAARCCPGRVVSVLEGGYGT
eukprot:6196129-Pleurochrysis_carterae.AAC.1